ncbi:MAG: hypothetical protein JW839_18530, partial [Candidatus Lokiarchaeota archaeon]|nr:hypothetical protein [Candidatus Lokiarchaeota archaeon]
DLTTLPASATAKGQQWYFTVEPFDGTAYGSPQPSPTRTIGNTAPSPPSSMSPTQTTDLTPLITWTGHSDVDGDPLNFYIRIVNGSNPTQVIVDWQPTASPSYQVLSALVLYQTYDVLIVATDGMSNSTTFQGPLITTNAPPSWGPGDHVSPDLDLNPFPTITWDAASDPDGQVPEYRFKIVSNLTGIDLFGWQFTGTTCSFTVNSSHELAPGAYRIQIVAYDGIDFSAMLEEILEILNSPPTFDSLVLNATSAREPDTIMAVPGGFNDTNSLDEEHWYYEWLVNGSVVLSGTSAFGSPILLNGTFFNKHDMVSCRVFAMDSHGAMSAANTTAAIPVLNSAPIVVEVTVVKNGTNFLQNETFYAQVTAFDADGDPMQSTCDWYVATMGFNYTWAYTGPSIYDPDRLYYHVGDAVIVSAVVSDGEDGSLPVNSTMIQIENSKPGTCTNPWLDMTVGEFSIPIVRWSPAFDWDGGFQTYEVMIGTKPLANDLLGISRVAEPYAALCYRYLNNGSLYRGTIYVHIRAVDDQGALSDQLLIYEVNWSPPSEERPTYILGLSLLFIIGGIALAFVVARRGERSMDTYTIKVAKKKAPVKTKGAGKAAPSYQEVPMKAAQTAGMALPSQQEKPVGASHAGLPAVPKVQPAPKAVQKVKKLVPALVEEHVPRKIDEATEKEVKVAVVEEKCIVCENKLQGTAYHCPHCAVKYCLRCASTLAQRHEQCWSCKNQITVQLPPPSHPAPATASSPVSPLAGTSAAAPAPGYKQVLKDRMAQVKAAIGSKDYTNALAWLQEMAVIAEKNGEIDLAANYKKKFEEVLALSVD